MTGSVNDWFDSAEASERSIVQAAAWEMPGPCAPPPGACSLLVSERVPRYSSTSLDGLVLPLTTSPPPTAKTTTKERTEV